MFTRHKFLLVTVKEWLKSVQNYRSYPKINLAYLSSSARSAGAAADLAASRKEAKYTSLTNSYIFQPIAVESHGSFSASSLSFLTTLGERLTGTSGDLREMS